MLVLTRRKCESLIIGDDIKKGQHQTFSAQETYDENTKSSMEKCIENEKKTVDLRLKAEG